MNEARVLILEDSRVDAELIERELRQSGLEFTARVVDTEQSFMAALEGFRPDIVLSDNALPSFDALAALAALRVSDPHTPFVVVSGTVGEEFAIEMLKGGVTDYVLKQRLQRVVPVVRRALAERRDRAAAHGAELATWEANEQFKNAFAHAPIGMALVGPNGAILDVNGQLCLLLGLVPDQASLSMFATLVHPGERADIAGRLESLLAGDIPSYRGQHALQHTDGNVVWVRLSVSLVSGVEGRPVNFIVQCQDLSATRRAEALLVHQAAHDPLTDLPNRTLVTDRIEHALDRSRQASGSVGVLFVDLDHFKVVNDSLGHLAGDDLLVRVAKRIIGALRASDTAGRMGGDEFVLVCEDIADGDSIRAIVERVVTALTRPFRIDGREITVTASIGVAVSTGHGTTASDLLRDADTAMYRAKLLGRNRWEIFDESMRQQAVARLEIETELREAIELGEFELFYQPVVDLSTGDLRGFEALSRWRHPRRGTVGPGEFIPIAESLGLIVRFGEWVLGEACREAVRWCDIRPDLVVAVNLSAQQVADPGLVAKVTSILTETGLHPTSLCLELTESAIIVASAATIEALATLRRQGVLVSIDDFGTGYSSLSYLVKFHPDVLKVDKSFVDLLGIDLEGAAVVETVIALAHKLRLTAVAEGVETVEQMRILQALGCDQAQGFLFATPEPVLVTRGLVEGGGHRWGDITGG